MRISKRTYHSIQLRSRGFASAAARRTLRFFQDGVALKVFLQQAVERVSARDSLPRR